MKGQLRLGTQKIAPALALRTLVTEENIAAYKAEDMADIQLNGGTLATDGEYAAAEVQLQQLYKKIMEGGSQNE